MEFDARAFQDLIDGAALNPAEFTPRLVEAVQNHGTASFPALIRVFEGSGEVSTKRYLADLFLGPLKGVGKHVFMPVLDRVDSEAFPWAAEILSRLKEKTAVPGLKAGLASAKADVIIASVRGLAEFTDPEVLKALIDFMLVQTEWSYLAAAMRYLLPHGKDVLPQLMDRYASLPKERQAWIIKFLAEVGDPSGLQLFSDVLRAQPLELGLFAVVGLGKIGTPASVRVLEENLKSPEWFLRKRVVHALGSATCPEAIPPLLTALTDPSVQVRMAAIESLSRVAPTNLEAVIAPLEKAPHDLKVGLIRVLAQIPDQRVVAPLAKTLQDRSTLFFSIDALGDVGFPEAAPHLEKLLKDAEWFNRLNALEALGKIKAPNLRRIAEGSLEDPNDMVRNAATRIMQMTAG